MAAEKPNTALGAKLIKRTQAHPPLVKRRIVARVPAPEATNPNPQPTDSPVAAPKAAQDYTPPEVRVRDAGFPVAHDPEFVEALGKLKEAHPLDTEYAQRVAIWLVLIGWQLKQLDLVRGMLHQRMEERGLAKEEREAIHAMCRRELLDWSVFEFRIRRDYVIAVDAWQVLTGAKPAPKKKPTPEDEVRHLLPFTPAYPPVRHNMDAWRETFIQQALLLYFRTGAKSLAARGIYVPVMN